MQILVHKGSAGDVRVYPRDVFCEAIRWRAAAVIVAHNHPSGDPAPSRDDLAVTRRLVEASVVVGIPLLDHLILGRTDFISLRESGDVAF